MRPMCAASPETACAGPTGAREPVWAQAETHPRPTASRAARAKGGKRGRVCIPMILVRRRRGGTLFVMGVWGLQPVGGRPLIIGHRGASARAPENSVEAFARARADGADGVELDVLRC